MIARSSTRESRLDGLLRLPLFYKILIANIAIVVVGAAAGTWITASLARGNPEVSVGDLVLLLAGTGAVASGAVNALILHLALRPLRLLQETVEEVGAGETAARVPDFPLSDRDLRRLASTFNDMLDTLAAYRRRLRAVAERSIHSAERERKRIARELHDDTAQRLVSLQLRARALRDADASGEWTERVDEIVEELRDAAESVRRLARGLRPPALDELGLTSAVRGYARTQSEAYGTTVEVAGRGDPALESDVALAVYRIVQEAVSNALRHGAPSRVEIDFSERPDALETIVRDDGNGFDPDHVADEEGAGHGLAGMRERVGYVGGSVEIDSERGRGTRVRIVVPKASGRRPKTEPLDEKGTGGEGGRHSSEDGSGSSE